MSLSIAKSSFFIWNQVNFMQSFTKSQEFNKSKNSSLEKKNGSIEKKTRSSLNSLKVDKKS